MPSPAATSKGAATRDLILDRAYAIACRDGVEGLSIGDLAQASGMSKSGVFAHFGSREALQLAVIEQGARRFGEKVLIRALKQARGMPRLRAIVQHWFDWVRDNRQGCLIMGAVSEYDSRPGPLRDAVVDAMRHWREAIARSVSMAIETGELRKDTDAAQLAFEIFGVALALHQDTRLFNAAQARRQAERAIDRLLIAYSR